MALKAKVENRPIDAITMIAPAYQRRWTRSNRGAGADAVGDAPSASTRRSA
jgi:hypothetical protein